MTFSIWLEIWLYCQSLFLGAGSVVTCCCFLVSILLVELLRQLFTFTLELLQFLAEWETANTDFFSPFSFKDFQLNSHLSTLANIHKIYHTLNKLVSQSLKIQWPAGKQFFWATVFDKRIYTVALTCLWQYWVFVLTAGSAISWC